MKFAALGIMGNPSLDTLMNVLYTRAVPILILSAIAALLMGFLARWLERRAVRHPRTRERTAGILPGPQTPSSDLTLDEGPVCPACDCQMVIRVARRGPKTGSRFWGCPNYPACRSTRALA